MSPRPLRLHQIEAADDGLAVVGLERARHDDLDRRVLQIFLMRGQGGHAFVEHARLVDHVEYVEHGEIPATGGPAQPTPNRPAAAFLAAIPANRPAAFLAAIPANRFAPPKGFPYHDRRRFAG